MISAIDLSCERQVRDVASELLNEGGSVFEPMAIELRVDQILRMLGYSDMESVLPAVRSVTESVSSQVQNVVSPIVYFKHKAIKSCADGVLYIEDDITLHCQAFQRYMDGCDEAVALVLTLGQSIDDLEAEFSANEQLLEMVILETAGWLAIEQATRQFTIHLRDAQKPGRRRLSRRMAPGYGYKIDGKKCDWSLEEQPKIFEFFEPGSLPVQLLESCAMTPKMSRSGLFGLHPY
jgi:hypothetical protein